MLNAEKFDKDRAHKENELLKKKLVHSQYVECFVVIVVEYFSHTNRLVDKYLKICKAFKNGNTETENKKRKYERVFKRYTAEQYFFSSKAV